MIQQRNEKLAPFKWYNHAPLGQISGCIKIDKNLKKQFLSDDIPSGIKLKKFTDSYRTAVEKWRSKISDETRNEKDHLRFFGSEKEQIMDHWDYPMSLFLRKL